MEDTDSDEDTPRASDIASPSNKPSVSQNGASKKVKNGMFDSEVKDEMLDCEVKGRADVAEKSRRISEHVKDAKERFRLAMKTEGERKMLSRADGGKTVHQMVSQLEAETQLKIFRGNLKSQNEKGQITLKDIPQLKLRPDIEPPDSARQATPTNAKDSLRLDLTPDKAGLSLRKPATKRIITKTNDINNSPPLTPRCTPRSIKRHDFSYIPTPRRSEDKLPTLSLSAKEDLIKEIAPGLLLRSKDSELTSSRSSVASSTSSLRSSVTSIISLTELKTLRVSCRVSEDAIVSTATGSKNNSNSSNNNSSSSSSGVTSVITSNMSVTDMKRVLLGRSRVRGVEPANFCVIAVRTIKVKATEAPESETEDEMVTVETGILEDDAHPFEEGGRHLRRTRFSIRPGRGKVVDIYDGRKWPVVRCGSVYITPSDSTTKVVQAVLATPTVKEKKRRAVKYTVAVGTSHGHVQAFLKDSDVVLGAFDQCPAEEKCLMLIKRPKESSKKLSKAQSGNSLSMSDTQLYRQFDGTAFNAPHSAHRMKDKTNATNDGRDQVMSEIYNSEPRVRRAAAPAAISAAHRKWPAARPNNTFVPIPELGIYTPEQHVLQNGTYAQHCHLREVNNNSHNTAGRRNMANGHSGGDGAGGGRYDNKPLSARTANNNHVTNSAYAINNTNHHNNHNNNNKMNHNSSLNSSFDESVSSYGYAPVKGVLRGYDPAAASGNIRYPSGDVYHSCVDISHTYRDGGEDEFNTLSSRRSYDPPGYAPIREEELEHVRGRNRSPEPPNRRRGERDKRQPGDRLSEEPAEEDAAKMDSGARSFSLGDLSAGLTFSLAGQQKSGSVTAVNGGGRKGRGLSSPGLAPKSARPAPSAASISSNDREEGSSALRHIRERLQKAVFKSQDRKSNSTNQPSTQAPRNAQSREGGGQYQRQYDNKQPPPHDNKQPPPPHQRQRQDQPHPPYQRQVSAPEGSQLLMSSPRNRRDSEDTTSSYRSVQSDNSNFANSNQNIPLSYSGLHNNAMGRNNKNINNCGNNNISNSSNSISSTLNNTDSSGNSFATAKSSSTVTNSTEINNAHPSHSQASNRDKSTASPTKPKRSLPNVPLSETSERIKRFTEMMKSRMSSGSRTGSSNGSRSGSSAKHTPTQRSTDSACSHTSLSRKSSMETASDSEVFTINNGTSTNNVRPPHGAGGGNTKHQPYQPQNIILPNQYPDFNERKNNGHGAHTTHNGPGSRHDDHHAQMSKGFTGQGQGHHTQRPLTSEDTPLPLGDRSTDSGQTTGTNQSYNGSAMDSGYTTNNDADNDSFNTHNQHHLQHHQPFQSLEPHQQQRHQHHESSGHQNHHSYHHQPQHHHHHHHPPHRQQTSGTSSHHAAHHQQYSSSTVSKSHNARSVNGLEKSDLPHPGLSSQQSHRPQFKRKSNLANAHRFGSVQNVSSLQAHGNPRDMDPLGNESTSYWHGQQQLSQNRNAGALSARERSSRQIYEENQTGLLDRRQNSGGRRSWDFADARMDNDRIGDPHFNNSNLKTYDRGAAHYKSTEVISSTKPLFTDANYVNTNHIHQSAYQSNKSGNNHINSGSNKTALTLQEQSRAIAAKFRFMHLSNGADSMSQSYHGGTTNQLPQNHGYGSNGVPNHSSSSTSQAKYSNNPKTFTSNGNSSAQPPSHRHNYQKHQNHGGQAEFKGNTTQQHQQFHDRHQLHPLHANQCHPLPHSQTNGSNNNGGVVKLRPVPMSRANRNARGRTLPGGFRFTDAEIAAAGAAGDGKNPLPSQNTKQPGQDQGQEVMLFHLTQKFDLCPLLVNLPRHVSLRDLLELSEFQVEISLVGVPGAEGSPLGGPSSPQGPVASKIGSPGSAFSPVRNSQDFEGGSGAGAGADAGKVVTAKVKVIRFIRVWGEELQRHTTLGRLLEGDIVVEVNGWFCLGADVTYLAQVVESCQGAITFTVARHKESEEKRFKGQTPVERVKGLEAEISRLDDIIHSKDEKIREMTSSRENLSGQQGALTAVNGEVPVEGMVIGEDEYVV